METLNIPFGDSYIVQGDTIPKFKFEFGVGDSIDLTQPNVSIKMQLFTDKNIKVMDLSIGNGITVESAKVFNIDEVTKENNNLPSGVLYGDLEITDGAGKRFTFFRVNYTITKQYTR